MCSYYAVCHNAEIKEVQVCVWAVINITLVDTIIYYNMRVVKRMTEICRRHTMYVTTAYFIRLRKFVGFVTKSN